MSLALIAIAIGAFARVDALDRKVLWFDESSSLLRISGHTQGEFYALFDNRVHRSDALLALQHVTPQRGLPATLASLREEPQRGPLYYLLARIWIGAVGNATAAVRGLSVTFGIGGIALAFALGRRLFGGARGGAILAALVALSPIEIRFSQQVREYVLVADLTLLSAWLLLRAFERPNVARWTLYAACAAAGLYTNVTFAFVILGHGIVTLVHARHASRDRRAAVNGYVAASALAAIAYAPWALSTARAASRHPVEIAWAAGAYPLRATLVKWAFNLGAVFFDSEYAHVAWGVVLIPLFAICALAFARAFARGSTAPERALPVAVALSALIPFVAIDLVARAHYELVARYQMPTWLGVSTIVAGFVVASLDATSHTMKRIGGCAFAFVFVCGAAAIVLDRPYAEWWDNNDHLSERAVAETISRARGPALVIASDDADDAYDTFVLSRYVAPDTAMLLVSGGLRTIPAGYATTFFFTPSRAELAVAASHAGRTPCNVSPSAGLAVPELNPARGANAETVVATNALWELARAAPADTCPSHRT